MGYVLVRSYALMETSEKIKKEFTSYLLENGSKPASVFKFAKGLKLSEAQFYDHYASFEDIEAEIWKSFIVETIAKLHKDSTYAQYTVREKLLAFYFTLFETLKGQRSFVSLAFENKRKAFPYPAALADFKVEFKAYIRDLIAEGKETQEIVERPLLKDKYHEPIWAQLVFLINFWLKDRSKGFEQTDVAIEKSVHLAFDLAGKNALDSAFDFAKFLFQQVQR